MQALVTLLLSLLLTSCTSYPAAASAQQDADVHLDPVRTLIIDGVIGRGNLVELGDTMQKMAAQSSDSITIIINSPGGSVVEGFRFINKMEAVRSSGVKLTCVVVEIAASMAFQILTHCDDRVSLDKSFLLWHGVRVFMMGALTAQQAHDMMIDLQALDAIILDELADTVGKEVGEQELLWHFHKETLHVGKSLSQMAPNFLRTHTAIPGLFEILSNPEVARSEEPSPFGVFRNGELVYIPSEYTDPTN